MSLFSGRDQFQTSFAENRRRFGRENERDVLILCLRSEGILPLLIKLSFGIRFGLVESRR